MSKTRTLPVPIALVTACVVLVGASALAGVPLWPGSPGISIAIDDVQGPLSWGETPNVYRLGRLWVSGQPDAAGLEAAKAAGVTTVLNLRPESETDWDERAAAEALGLRYLQVPVERTGFEQEALAAIDALHDRYAADGLLVHCSSGNRVAGWIAARLVERHGIPAEDAIAAARRAGLTNAETEANVRAYLDRSVGTVD